MSGESISNTEFKLLRDFIEQHCGICLGEEKAYLIETRLAGLMVENGCPDFGSFYRLAKSDTSPNLREKIIDAMTTNETLWFRDAHPFTILRDELLPPMAAEILEGRRFRIRIWSAACSTGQEPYSIAMVIHEFCRTHPGLKPHHFEILASDISPSALFLAKAGRFDENALRRGLPDELRSRYFRQDGSVWVANAELRELVTFRKFNLQDPVDALGHFDIIFCRYVAIYFADEFKKRIFTGMARLLAPSGHLFVSAVESLRGISDEFTPLTSGGGLYYQCNPLEGTSR
jgi:chemotaxis protein methyltransferase CheR